MSELKLVIVPDEEDPGAFVFVDGFLDKNPYRFLLDTGAASSEICYDFYTSNFKKKGNKQSSGAFASEVLDVIQVPNIVIGPIYKNNYLIRRQSESSKNQFNLIGMDILKDYCCYFQFNNGNVLIDPPLDEDLNFLPLLLGPKNHPYVEVKLQDTPIKAVWDTGASITIVDQKFIEENLEFFKKMGESTGTDATGTSQDTITYLLKSYTIGTNVFPATEVVGVDLSYINSTTEIPMTMILGYTTICKANWLFDFPQKCWVITKML